MVATSLGIESKIGVPHLVNLWTRFARNGAEECSGRDWIHDKITIHGLGISLEETFAFLVDKKPTFEDFESWIISINGGVIPQKKIARINAVVTGTPYDDETNAEILALETSEPVLSEHDLLFWREHGYVVLHDAVTPEQCNAVANVIFEHLRMSPTDPNTWYSGPRSHNIMVQSFHDPALQANRDSHRIHKAFAQLWGTADLWCSIDRVSFNPPETDEWKFPGPRLHWDTSLSLPIKFSVSGILYLTDTSVNQGAFTCVPGFHRHIETWLQTLPPDSDPRSQDFKALGATPIAGKAGDLIMWDERLPHGSSPNSTARPRLAQYITLYPPTMEHSSVWK